MKDCINRYKIIKDLENIYKTFGIETCNDYLNQIVDRYEQQSIGKAFEESIKLSPLYFEEVTICNKIRRLPPFQLFELIFDENNHIGGAYVSDYRSGPPDSIDIKIEFVPTEILYNIYNELKTNFLDNI